MKALEDGIFALQRDDIHGIDSEQASPEMLAQYVTCHAQGRIIAEFWRERFYHHYSLPEDASMPEWIPSEIEIAQDEAASLSEIDLRNELHEIPR